MASTIAARATPLAPAIRIAARQDRAVRGGASGAPGRSQSFLIDEIAAHGYRSSSDSHVGPRPTASPALAEHAPHATMIAAFRQQGASQIAEEPSHHRTLSGRRRRRRHHAGQSAGQRARPRHAHRHCGRHRPCPGRSEGERDRDHGRGPHVYGRRRHTRIQHSESESRAHAPHAHPHGRSERQAGDRGDRRRLHGRRIGAIARLPLPRGGARCGDRAARGEDRRPPRRRRDAAAAARRSASSRH